MKAFSQTKRGDLIEAPFVIAANDAFHKISDDVLTRYGELNNQRILFRWREWLKSELQKGVNDANLQ